MHCCPILFLFVLTADCKDFFFFFEREKDQGDEQELVGVGGEEEMCSKYIVCKK